MTTEAPEYPAIRAGDEVILEGDSKPWIFVGPKGVMVEIARDGKTELAPPSKVSPANAPARPEGDAMFDRIVQQFDGLLARLRTDMQEYQARVDRRRQQIKRIEAVLRTLRDPQLKPGRGGRLPCGHWPRERAHQACMKEKA